MKKFKFIVMMFVIASITSSFYITYIGKKFNKIIYNYINIEVKRFTNNVVNTSVNEVITNYNSNEFIIIKYNSKGIETVDLNTRNTNKILKEINNKILNKLRNLEIGHYNNFKVGKYKQIKNGVLCEIPISLLKNNSSLSNIGPTIPIKLSFSGNVTTKTKTNITSYGINNVILEVNIVVEIEEQVTMPISSKNEMIIIEAPLILKIIPGQVPEYYETDLKSAISSSLFYK